MSEGIFTPSWHQQQLVWLQQIVARDRKRKGIEPYLPAPEDRRQAMEDYKHVMPWKWMKLQSSSHLYCQEDNTQFSVKVDCGTCILYKWVHLVCRCVCMLVCVNDCLCMYVYSLQVHALFLYIVPCPPSSSFERLASSFCYNLLLFVWIQIYMYFHSCVTVYVYIYAIGVCGCGC